MKNLGSINGKVEVCVMDAGIMLVAGSNVIGLSIEEAVDLGDVLEYAATNQMHLLPECKTWIPSGSLKHGDDETTA